MLSRKLIPHICLILINILSIPACEKKIPVYTCEDSIACIKVGADEPIKIAAIQALSGGAVSFGKDQVRALELAIDEMDGQLLGHPVVLQIEDGLCTPEGGANAALRIVADPEVVGVIGTTCSGSAETASEITSKAGLLMISGANSAANLTSIGDVKGQANFPGYFRTSMSDVIQGRAGAAFAYEQLGVKKIALIHDGGAYTRGMTEMFQQVFTTKGGDIVLRTDIQRGDTNMKPVLEACINSGAELIFFPLFKDEGVQFLQQASEVQALSDTIFMGAGPMVSDDFIEAVGEHGIGMYMTSVPQLSSPSIDHLIARYKGKYGEAPATATFANAHDAASLLFEAIKSVAVLHDDGALYIGREALRSALYKTQNFQGATGNLSCTEYGDCAAVRAAVVRLDDPSGGVKGLKENIIQSY